MLAIKEALKENAKISGEPCIIWTLNYEANKLGKRVIITKFADRAEVKAMKGDGRSTDVTIFETLVFKGIGHSDDVLRGIANSLSDKYFR